MRTFPLTSRAPRAASLAGWLAALALVLVSAPAPAAAAPEDPAPAAPGAAKAGPQYAGDQAGVTATGPSGWRMKAEKGGPVEWSRLVTFFDPGSDADAVLSVRKRTSTDTQALLAKVRTEWRGAKDFTVRATRKIDPSAQQPVGSVIVDAGFTVKAKPKRGGNPGIAPPPVPYRVQATYYLAPDAEYLLYVQAKQTFWSRVAPGVRAMEASLRFRQPTAGKNMEPLTFRDEKRGFTCQYPAAYGVALPERPSEVVEFRGVSEGDPTITVYSLAFDKDVDADAKRVRAFYESEQGGEVTSKAITFAGKDAVRLDVVANLGGTDSLVFLLMVKRNNETLFRLKCTMPAEREAEGRRLFKQFIESFRLI